ncbi:MAG: CbtA family protein [Alphaproteobacteria bacterium]|jgi:cobalt transporter subunit CbtA|nr:CbtA family protein [Alphaproteobacteria bacterium]MDP6591281.1 CbtA family protein [Alphaproteobacteria bacterium]MDP6817656.1 CbtA family protein [Alphaproteobacteria bacterium]|tara:strand:+ start:41 stop:778 length:738 start_codon:yes stop_codon:yes gene_type:complete
MALLGRILLPAVIAGILSGALLTGLQHIEVIPLIYQAETFENSAAAVHAHDHEAAGGLEAGAPESEPWAPDDGIERTAITLLANIVAAVGFALLLSVAFVLLSAKGRSVVWRGGLLWGLAGFGIFNLAPALGLPPELPGSEAAALDGRQGWWILTVVLTALGLGLIAFARPVYVRALGVIPLVIPHVIGAPAPEHHGGLAPQEMAERFVYASLATSAAFWLALGALTAFAHGRLARFRRGRTSPA